MKLSILGLLISSTLCGCAIFEDEYTNEVNDENLQSPYSSNIISSSETSTPLESSNMFQQQFQNKLANTSSANHNIEMGSSHSNNENKDYKMPIPEAKLNINHYAKGIMQDLVENLQYVNSTTPVAVVSFVMLDTDYNQLSLLGNQMAESLIHEIHVFGIPVIDFKTTDYIRITEQGDFAFTRDYEELSGYMPARYIVAGTMLKHDEGYLINARIVGVKSKAVVASAQSFIPNNIIEAIMPNNDELADTKLKQNSSNLVSLIE